MLTPN